MRHVVSLPDDASKKLADVACVLWPHHPIEATNFLKSSSIAPAPESIATLPSGISIESREDLAQLNEVLGFLAGSASQAERITVSAAILQGPPTNSTEEADIPFSMWIDCCGDASSDILKALLFSEELTDEQRMRAWLKGEKSRKSLGREWFLEVLPNLMILPESPETNRKVIESQERVTELFNSEDEKYDLAKVLLTASQSSPSSEMLGGQLQWLSSLEVEGVLKELSSAEPLNMDYYNALKSAFPNSRHLKKVKVEQAGEAE
jgi:hypothetical protein